VIGIAAAGADLEVAGEFFELFKTPWEPAVPSRRYRVLLSTNGSIDGFDADVFLVYGADAQPVDRVAGVTVKELNGSTELDWEGTHFPVYGRTSCFDGRVSARGPWAASGAVSYQSGDDRGRPVRRVGYDLFNEVRHLLTKGQPTTWATTPTLDLHISILRRLLVESRVSFLEIPPHPHQFDFICCLTHDVDFFGIRRHFLDRTLAGFVARASVGTLADLLRGRRQLSDVARNWTALASLPVVFLGLAPDLWRPFDDYERVEPNRASTFFLIPFKGRPGLSPSGRIDPARAVAYQLSEVRAELETAMVRGSEVSVHGIDAWHDVDAGKAELRELTSVTGRATAGVRMHWLYYSDESPARLEAAGFDYDSTCGYNDAVGYRAGTSQVFRLQGSRNLLELPLSIMDTAMFYPDRMDLAPAEARTICRRIVEHAREVGGTIVVNWHDRSLVPERLWESAYRELLREIEANNARVWFATAGDAVNWFRWRRGIVFRPSSCGREVTISTDVPPVSGMAARLRIHRAGSESVSVVEERSFGGLEEATISV
jgi:hypothetical protein